MSVDALVSVEGVEVVTDDSATCIARCLKGALMVGDAFDTATGSDGTVIFPRVKILVSDEPEDQVGRDLLGRIQGE